MIDFSLSLAALQDFQFFGHQWRLANPQWLMLGWAAPIVAFAIVFFASRSSSNQRRIVDEAMIDSTFGRSRRWNTWVHAVVAMVATLSIAIAIAQPQSDPREIEVEARGRDVVFMADVSRSMLAEDVAPNRLEKSKLWINDLVDNLGNDRVGLVAFAGSSTVLSPLTTDRLFFKLALEELSPESVLVGGTNIGDAIRRTMDLVFTEPVDNETQNFRDIVIISDGEDQESLPIEAARAAGNEGVRIITIGIGSDQGALVPPSNRTARLSGSSASPGGPVRSRLEGGTLRTIAAASPGGVYLEVGTGTIDLAQVYQELIATAEQRTIETTSQIQYTERFMVFIAIGLGLIMLDTLLIPVGTRRAAA